ncbi:uncharacterized protein METZ01_LOCUS439484 [marine metagenome]|uniref:Uncharacterized protein n=1 Tax=marine metagenome TaxID=408172 RepID=A0A382YU49_9ZZZZ
MGKFDINFAQNIFITTLWALSQLSTPYIRAINRIETPKLSTWTLIFQNQIIHLGFIPIGVGTDGLVHPRPSPTPYAQLLLTEPATRFVTAGARF